MSDLSTASVDELLNAYRQAARDAEFAVMASRLADEQRKRADAEGRLRAIHTEIARRCAEGGAG